MFDAGKTRMIGLPYGEKKQYVKPFSYNCFHTIPERNERICYINIVCQYADAQ